MEISVRKTSSYIVFRLDGNLDAYSSIEFKNLLEENLQGDTPSIDVIIDMEGLSYLDSSGIGSLIKAFNYCKENGYKIRIANLKPSIEKIFKVSGLTSHFKFLSSDDFKQKIH